MEHPEIHELLAEAIREGVFPGAVYAIGRGDRQWSGAVGRYTYCPDSPEMALDTWFDLASVSKVVSTTTLAMLALTPSPLEGEGQGRGGQCKPQAPNDASGPESQAGNATQAPEPLPPSPLPQGEGELGTPPPLRGRGRGGGSTDHDGPMTAEEARSSEHANALYPQAPEPLPPSPLPQGEGELRTKVADILPEFAADGKGEITLEDLVLHHSGLAAFRPFHQTLTEPAQVWEAICREAPQYPRGSKTVYSDLGMITLARVLEKLGGKPLDVQWHALAAKHGLAARYAPDPNTRPKCAPTETVEDWRRKLWQIRGESPKEMVAPDGTKLIQGEVHDPTATVLKGVAGHAGLFSTAPDLARFCRLLLGGEIVPFATLRDWIRRRGPSSRAYGWDTNWKHEQSAGRAWPEDAFGHTGYTGTSVWMHLPTGAYAVLLTNRVCPTAANTKIIGFRPKFHALVARVVGIESKDENGL